MFLQSLLSSHCRSPPKLLLPALVVVAALAGRASGLVKEAVAHIQCEVCEEAVEAAASWAKEQAIRDEDGLSDLVDNLCSVKKKEGRWVARLDIVREDDDAQLTLARQTDMGECKNECLTVQRACQAALKGREEQLMEMMLGGKKAKDIKKKLCKKSCSKEIPKLGKSWKDEAFVPRDQKEVETEDMMEKMKAETGMGMKMYKREDLLSMSEGDMEAFAAREAFSSERAAARMESESEL